MANGKRVTFTTKSKKRGSTKKKGTGKKSVRKGSSSKRKSNKRRRSRSGSHMPKKKKGSKHRPGKKSFIDRIPILNNPTVQRVGFGLGMGVLAVSIINLAARFAPPAIAQPLQQNQRIIKLAVEAITEPISAVVDLVLPTVTGQGNGFMQTGQQNVVGFA